LPRSRRSTPIAAPPTRPQRFERASSHPVVTPRFKIITDLAEAEAARLKGEYVST
jgi:hypothetical protein